MGYFASNPDFNEVLIFYGLEAISFRNHHEAKKLKEQLQFLLQKINCDNWPYKNSLMLAIDILGPTKMYSKRDVDNMSKAILDAGNKIIYDDDRLIDLLIIRKKIWGNLIYGFQIGIRVIEVNEKYSPTLYYAVDTESHDINNSKAPLLFFFENEADKEYVKQFELNKPF